jgi:hypothetical protein
MSDCAIGWLGFALGNSREVLYTTLRVANAGKEERRGFVAEKARLIKLADRVRLLLHLFAETQRI